MALNPIPSCIACGYSKHVEVCHIRAVADFSGTALLEEINQDTNLVGLCPNHHWEFDHGLLELPRRYGRSASIEIGE